MSASPLVQVHQEGMVTVAEFTDAAKLIEEPILERLNQELQVAVEHADPARLVLDLSRTEFFGSSFIETLFRTSRKIQQANGKFALCGVRSYCREVLEITHLDRLWPIYDTRAEAVVALTE
jgi:anti-sigma B factor antagonist